MRIALAAVSRAFVNSVLGKANVLIPTLRIFQLFILKLTIGEGIYFLLDRKIREKTINVRENKGSYLYNGDYLRRVFSLCNYDSSDESSSGSLFLYFASRK